MATHTNLRAHPLPGRELTTAAALLVAEAAGAPTVLDAVKLALEANPVEALSKPRPLCIYCPIEGLVTGTKLVWPLITRAVPCTTNESVEPDTVMMPPGVSVCPETTYDVLPLDTVAV